MVEGECCSGEAGRRIMLLLLSCGAGGVVGIGWSSGANGLGGGVLGGVGGVVGAVRIGIFCVDAVANGGGIGGTVVEGVGAGGYVEGAGGEGGLGGGAIG